MRNLLVKATLLWAKRHSASSLLRQLGFRRFAKELTKLTLLTLIGHESMKDALVALRERRRFSRVEVLLISSNPNSPSNPYRIDNPRVAFERNGFVTRVVHPAFLEGKDSLPQVLKFIWMYRPSFDGTHLQRLLKKSGDGVAVIYDNDDLTFDPQHYNASIIPGLRALNMTALERVLSDIPAQQELIKWASHVSASTSFLLDRIQRINPQSDSLLMGNFLTESMTAVASNLELSTQTETDKDNFKIVYASGSSTHQEDFDVAWPQVTQFLVANPKSSLTVIGHSPISLHQVPLRIRPQVQITSTYFDQETLLKELSNYDLNIAPLDTSIDFNHAKSSLKVIHAGAVGVRTVASQTAELEEAIGRLNSGQCVSPEKWLEGLEREMALYLQGGHDRLRLRGKTLQIYGFEAFIHSFSTHIERLEDWIASDTGARQ